MARTMHQRMPLEEDALERAEIDECAQQRQRGIAHAAVPQPHGETEEVGPEGPPAPEDQVNHIPVRQTHAVAPQGDARGGDSGAAGHGSPEPVRA